MLWTYVTNDLNREKTVGTFYKQELQKGNQKEFRIEKVIKRNVEKLYVKWKGCKNWFNSWVDKKDIVKISEYFPKTKILRRKCKS